MRTLLSSCESVRVSLRTDGFPRKSGGPIHWARHIRPGGLPKIVEDLRTFAAAHPTVPHWEPCALLVQEAAATSKL
jgi:hypothetical protein